VAVQRNRTAAAVERFFQFSLLGLIATGFLALAASRYLDRPTLALTFAALVLRGLIVAGWVRLEIPARIISLAALGYVAFYPLDFYFISRDFLAATVHGVCFLAAIKILTATSNRDYLYTGAIAFIELIGAALLSFQASFFGFLALYILFAIAAFTSAEIRRGFQRSDQIVYAPDGRVGLRLAAVAGAATCGILLVTTGLFLIVPRTARAAAMLFPHVPHLTGYSNVVDLGQFGEIGRDTRPVMHVLSYSRALPPNLKWRGAALSHFDGKRWFEPPVAGKDIPVVHGTAEVADQLQRSRRDGRRLLYRVDVGSSDTGTLFVAGIPEYINVASPRLIRTREDSFRVLPVTGEDLHYEISAHSGPSLAEPLYPDDRGRYLRLPPIDTRIWALARQWAGEGDAFERARRIQEHLRHDFEYSLESSDVPLRDPLGNFLFVTKRGYCEYFASAMAVILRTLGIPSRVATGFQSGFYNEVSGMYVMRASDAHVWVEAWFERRGWVTMDPTPPSANGRNDGLSARLNMYFDAADSMWQQWVVAYDLGHQAALAAKFAGSLRNWNRNWTQARLNGEGGFGAGFGGRMKKFGAWAVALALLAGMVIFAGPRVWREWSNRATVRRIARQGASASDAALLYRRMLEAMEKRGFERPSFFTPVEFARHLPPGEIEPVAEFTAVYNAVRFGGDTAGAAELVKLLEPFERRS
jgi:transglutaminase-like putative cysteine protease